MAVIGNLVADLSANSAAFNRDMTNASRNLSTNTARINRSLSTVDRGFAGIRRQVSGLRSGLMSMRGLLAGAAVGGLIAAGRASLQYADNLAKQADATGLAVETLSALEYQASQTGASQQQLASGMSTFARGMGQLQSGTGRLRTFLMQYDRDLYEHLRTVNSQEEAVRLVSDAMANAETPARRAALAAAAFGGAGERLVLTFGGGRSEIERYREEAERLGLVMSEQGARGAERLNDRIDQLSRQLRMQFTTAVVNSAEEIESFVNMIADSLPTIIGWGNALARNLGLTDGQPRTRGQFAAQIAEVDQLTEALQRAAMAGRVNDSGAHGLRNRVRDLLGPDEYRRINQQIFREDGLGAGVGFNGGLIGRREAYTRQFDVFIQELQTQRARLAVELRALEEEANRPRLPRPAPAATDEGDGAGGGLVQDMTETRSALSDLLDEIEGDLARRRQAMAQSASSLFDATRTPLEAYRIELERIASIETFGALDEFGGDDTAIRARVAALLDMAQATGDVAGAVAELQTLSARGLIDRERASEAAQAIGEIAEASRETGREVATLAGAGRRMIGDWRSEVDRFTEGFQSMGDTVRGVLRSIALQLARMGWDRFVFGPLEGAMGGFLSGLGGGGANAVRNVSKGAIPKFQRGGSFQVGGAGGVDSQLVSFFATPGEGVEVTPSGAAGRRRGGGGPGGAAVYQTIVNEFHLHAEGAVMTEELIANLEASSAARAERARQEGAQTALSNLSRQQRYGLGA